MVSMADVLLAFLVIAVCCLLDFVARDARDRRQQAERQQTLDTLAGSSPLDLQIAEFEQYARLCAQARLLNTARSLRRQAEYLRRLRASQA